MKFSYPLIKKIFPQAKSKAEAIEALTMHAFEAEDAPGNIFEVTLPPNRYSDAASHLGIAKELAAIFNKKTPRIKIAKLKNNARKLKVEIKDKKGCSRYTAALFENISLGQSPNWLRKALEDCGLRPINNVVDIMNYAMLEVGEPLHVFDADKLATSDKRQGIKKIVVRRAKRGESIVSIDGNRYKLSPETLVIADQARALAIAGVKGGRGSEVTEKTKRIIVEAASFDPVSIYKTSRALNLVTDASLRFSHGISPDLASIGLARAAELLKEITGAKLVEDIDTRKKDPGLHVIKLDENEFSRFIGLRLSKEEIANYLRRLGFRKVGPGWEPPQFRVDIQTKEDLAEEVVRLHGLNKLKSSSPIVALRPSETDEAIVFREKAKKALIGFGLDEVYNYSMVSKDDLKQGGFWPVYSPAIQNPISLEFTNLRPNLAYGLIKNAEENLKFFNEARIFEIGRVFGAKDFKKPKISPETTNLGIILKKRNSETFFELKGIVDELLKWAGLTNFFMRDLGVKVGFLSDGLRVESDHSVLGYLGRTKDGASIAEINLEKLLELVEGENSFEPLSKYPSVMRDISILVNVDTRIGDLIEAMQNINPRLIKNVDLVDEYADDKWEKIQSITFRIVFQAENRTLKSEEVDKEMKKIVQMLEDKFEVQTR